jgi:hypothetical protein
MRIRSSAAWLTKSILAGEEVLERWKAFYRASPPAFN